MEDRNYIKDCVEVNITGKHAYITNEDGKEECKFCHLLRSTIESSTTPVADMLVKAIDNSKKPIKEGEHKGAFEVQRENIPSPYLLEMGEFKNILKPEIDRRIPDSLFNEILRTTKSQSAIVFTFDKPIMSTPFKIPNFHISSVNISFRNIKHLVGILADALHGRLGGDMKIDETKK